VLVQRHADEQEIVKMEVFNSVGRLTDSVEADVCGIALALDMAIQHYISRELMQECKRIILSATFDFIKNSTRCL